MDVSEKTLPEDAQQNQTPATGEEIITPCEKKTETVSQKKDLKKKFRLAWFLFAIIFIAVTAIAVIRYVPYKKVQDLAVVATQAVKSGLSDDMFESRKELVHEVWLVYNPTPYSFNLNGVKFDNTESVKTAREADKALAKVIEAAGFDCPSIYGSYFLEYYGLFEHIKHETKLPFIIVGVLFTALFTTNMLYKDNRKKQMIVCHAEGEEVRVVCKKGKKIKKEFFARDITNISAPSSNALQIKGNGINYKINLLNNADELKKPLMEALHNQKNPVYAPPVQTLANSASDEIKKFKDLLDQGIITREEFEEKKKQLLGL